MKWKTWVEPKESETREWTQFAFWPVECDDGYTRWLCDVVVHAYYKKYVQGGGSSIGKWKITHYSPVPEKFASPCGL